MNKWTEHANDFSVLLSEISSIAQRNGYTLNKDTERVEKVVGKMTNNLVGTGKRICPCKQSHPINAEKDAVCPCPSWKEEIESTGACHCKLFYKA